MAIIARGVDVAVDHATGATMVGIERRVVAEADDVAPPLRIIAEHVVDLPDREVVIAAVFVADGVAVDERQERRVGRIAQRPPRVEEGQAAGGVFDSSARVADRPVVEPALGIGLVDRLAGRLREEHGGAVGLVVPRVCPLQLLTGEAGSVNRLRLGQIRGIAGRLVKPRRPPGQLVVVAAERVVIGRGVGNAVGILPPIGVGKREQLAGVPEEQVGIDGIRRPEHDRGRSERRRRFARHIGAGARGVDLGGRPAHRHHLGRPPEGMVGAAVADLGVKHVRRRVRLDEPVGAPLERVEHLR